MRQSETSDNDFLVLRTFKIDLSLWEMARLKAGLTPISAILRELVKMWIEGKIEVKLSRE